MKMYKDYNIDDNVNGSGTELSEQDQVLLNIIRNGANKVGILAAYKARKRCIALLKKLSKAASEDYVDTLILKYYPNEFKKVELGRKYRMYLVLSIIGGISTGVLGLCGMLFYIFYIFVCILLLFTIISIYNLISVKKFFNQLMIAWERNVR